MKPILTIVLSVVAMVLLVDLMFSEQGLLSNRNMALTIEHEKAKNEALRARNEKMKKDIQHMSRDKSALEEQARQTLGMIGKGERLYQLSRHSKSG